MKDIDIDNAIESVDSERKAELLAQLHARLDLPKQEESQTKIRKRFFNVKSVAFGVAGIFAVSLAIVLPISLRNNTSSPSQNKYTYTAADFLYDNLGITLKEYSEQTGKSILYIDWYDIADDCMTTKYFLPEEKDKIIYISEDLYNGETGDHVWIAVVDTNIYIDELDSISDTCLKNYEYRNTNINWMYDISMSRAYFEYGRYKYYVRLDNPMSEQAIFDIIQEMF